MVVSKGVVVSRENKGSMVSKGEMRESRVQYGRDEALVVSRKRRGGGGQ